MGVVVFIAGIIVYFYYTLKKLIILLKVKNTNSYCGGAGYDAVIFDANGNVKSCDCSKVPGWSSDAAKNTCYSCAD